MPPLSPPEHYPAGETATNLKPGEFLLTHGTYRLAKLISFAQRLGLPKEDRPFAYYQHAALVVSGTGALVEALGNGVVRSDISDYEDREYHLVRIDAEYRDRSQMYLFAQSVLAAKTSYGYLTILSLLITYLSGFNISFEKTGTSICSGLVANSLVRAGYIFPKPPDFCSPSDLAKFFGVIPPAPQGDHVEKV